jgi:DNA-binding IscR family transcriptional regulator
VLHGPCLLKHGLNRALEAFFTELDQITLADLARPAPSLRVAA